MTQTLDFEEFEKGLWLENFQLGSCVPAFDNLTVEFLSCISKAILSSKDAREFPDLITLGFFCRTANIRKIANSTSEARKLRGWGTVFHVAPSNIPINFAFSLVFGLLSGNSNIVRMPTDSFEQANIFIKVFFEVATLNRFKNFLRQNVFVKTLHDSDQLSHLVSVTNGLIVWGGDATVTKYMQMDKRPDVMALYFPNKVSSCVIDLRQYTALSKIQKQKLAINFYNDTFLFDQNACSSPSKIFWICEGGLLSADRMDFWKFLQKQLIEMDYRLDPVAQLDRLLDVMEDIKTVDNSIELYKYSSSIWLLNDAAQACNAHRYGVFTEVGATNMGEAIAKMRPNEQTLTYFGVESELIEEAVTQSLRCSIDRVIPIGNAFDMGHVWDGKNLILSMSRYLQAY